MNGARTGHTATTLADGRILIAAGDAQGTAQIYDPATRSFALLPGRLGVPRQSHGAVLLQSGQVLIVGGLTADGTSALDSAELFDPASQSFASIGSLQVARWRPTLRVLPDGKVQIAGGNADSSIELFDPTDGAFRGHARVLNDSNAISDILRARTRAALIHPIDPYDALLQSQLTPPTQDLLDRQDHSLTEVPQANEALVAGGVGSANKFLRSAAVVQSSGATLTTDKSDYPPGSVVDIFGANWQPRETVLITIHEEPPAYPDPAYSVVADSAGGFINMSFSPTLSDVGRTFTVTAVGQSSGFVAQTTFTDGVDSVTLTSPTTASPVTLTSFPLTANIAFNYSTSAAGTTTGVASVATSPVTSSPSTPLTSGLNQSATIPMTLPAGTLNGSYNASVTVTNTSGTGANNKSDNANNGVHVDVPITQLAFTTSAFTISVNTCSGKITVESRDVIGAARNPFSALTVSLSSTSGGGTFFSNNSCSSATTSVTIASNKTSMDFWYKDSSAGRPRITASASYESGPTFSAAQLETIGTVSAPTVTSISPTSKTVNDAGFTMTVNGTTFVLDSVVRFNGADRTTSFVNGGQLTGSIPATDLTTAGTFNITVFTPAPGGGTSNAQTFTVNPATTTTAISAPAVTYLTNGVVTVTVSSTAGTPTGNVTLAVDGGVAVSKALSGGSATFTNTDIAALGSPSAGDHPLSASYVAQGNFDTSTASGTLHVNQAATTTAISAPTITYNANGSVTVTVAAVNAAAGTPTENVPLAVDGGVAVSKALSSGSATFTNTDIAALGSPSAGNHPLSASYAAQGNFDTSTASGTLHVNRATTTAAISAPTITYNANGSVTVTVSSTAGTPTGNVTLAVDGGVAVSKALSSGSATFTNTDIAALASPSAGNHTLSASYAAQGNFAGSSATGMLHVNQATPTVSVTGGTFAYNGVPQGATGFAYGVGGVSDVLSPAVTFSYQGIAPTTYGPTATAPTGAGTYQVMASFAGNTNYMNASNTAALTISPKAASVTPNTASKTYGDADSALSGTLTGFVAADGVTATYSRTAGETVAGSPYTISAVLSPAG